ncbi:MAG: RnfABCDGE type electron transport complex subunit D, partial [Gammaproteobacteria bacterium]|nr:RnfABCDGE type electron transport complex subunit D [Gammaproteobacteria bacterium]
MLRLRQTLDHLRPLFVKGGRFERFFAIYEMVDTFLYSPPDVTRTSPHARDGIDLKRVMVYVVLAALPCVVMACWNTGYQANTAMGVLGLEEAAGWRGQVLNTFGIDYAPTSTWDNFWHGF